jgi:hypothetical protein
MFSLVQPELVGVKITFTSTLCPAGTTIGMLSSAVLNSELLDEISVIVTLVGLVLVRVMSNDSDLPRSMDPNLSIEGELVNCCVLVAACAGNMASACNVRPMTKKFVARK